MKPARYLCRGVMALVLISLAATAHAELIVVTDRGGQPARPYYGPIKPARVPERLEYSAQAEAMPTQPVTEADMLPVHSQRLSPGSMATRAIHLPPIMTPFFLIGTDELSRRWLKQRGPRLRELGAVGLVVDVAGAAQLQRLRRLGHGLVLRSVHGDDIARRLGITHYPVLITPEAIQQ